MATYLLTFRCYGTWLHGDERGAVHPRNNAYGTPLLDSHCGWERTERRQMKHEIMLLDADMRKVVETAILEVVAHRGWEIFALAVRTNHVHAVVGADAKPERVLNDFKAWSTRRLREAGLLSSERRLWAKHGSTRYLWDDNAVVAACGYVAEGQGEDIGV